MTIAKVFGETLDLTDEQLLQQACRFAVAAHEGQKRKFSPNVDYVQHPLDVGALAAYYGLDCHYQVAGILHDVVEDTDVTLDDVVDYFGVSVARIVQYMTDVFTKERYPGLNREERKRMEAARLIAGSVDDRALKLCDVICNLRDVNKMPLDFLMNYVKEKDHLVQGLIDHIYKHHQELAYQARDSVAYAHTILNERVGAE